MNSWALRKGNNWEYLHLILAIVQGRCIAGAARGLGIHHATVFRRLDRFERQTGVLLFEAWQQAVSQLKRVRAGSASAIYLAGS